MKKPRLMIVEFQIPIQKIKGVENFLAKHPLAQALIRSVFRNRAELMEVRVDPRAESVTITTRQYKLVVSDKTQIVNALFDHNFIPPGRMWMVLYYPARKKYLDRLNLDKNGFPKKPAE